MLFNHPLEQPTVITSPTTKAVKQKSHPFRLFLIVAVNLLIVFALITLGGLVGVSQMLGGETSMEVLLGSKSAVPNTTDIPRLPLHQPRNRTRRSKTKKEEKYSGGSDIKISLGKSIKEARSQEEEKGSSGGEGAKSTGKESTSPEAPSRDFKLSPREDRTKDLKSPPKEDDSKPKQKAEEPRRAPSKPESNIEEKKAKPSPSKPDTTRSSRSTRQDSSSTPAGRSGAQSSSSSPSSSAQASRSQSSSPVRNSKTQSASSLPSPRNSKGSSPAKSSGTIPTATPRKPAEVKAPVVPEGPKLKGPCKVTNLVRKYTLDKIQESTLIAHPFPYVYITDIFQPDFYDKCIMPNLIPTENNLTKRVFKENRNYPGRHQLKLRSYRGVALSDDLTERGVGRAARAAVHELFWEEFAREFAHKDLMKEWLQLFRPVVSKRIPETSMNESLPFRYLMEMNRDLDGFSMGPHTDSEVKWVTTIFYLGRNVDRSNLGTLLLRNTKGHEQQGSERLDPNNEDFQTAQIMHYMPNSLLAFAPCYTSWHSVPLVDGPDIVRDSIQGFITSRPVSPKQECEISVPLEEGEAIV